MSHLNTRIILRNDSTNNWSTAVTNAGEEGLVLLKGEIGIEFTDKGPKMKIGDGVTKWQDLSYFGGEESKTFQVSSLDEITIVDLAVGDTAIVKTAIYVDTENEVNSKYSYTGYVYNGTGWAAMDGNYSADNVYFDDDMMVTTNIGYITTNNGSGTIPSKGKNLTGVFEAMFVKEQDPSKTDPSVSVTLTHTSPVDGKEKTTAGSYEVGSSVTNIKFSASFDDGNYSYGPEPTGAVVSEGGWSATDSKGGQYTTNSSDIDDILVTDGLNFTVTAKAVHTAGRTPLTNKGNDCTDSTKRITAGTKSKASVAITGYRSFFYGALTVAPSTTELTSEMIRGLVNGGNYNGAKSFTIKADGATNLKAFVVAIPDTNTRAGITKVNSTAGMTVDMTESYVKTESAVSVADARGTVDGVDMNPVDYDLYIWEPASIDSGAVHEFTLG